VVVGLGSCLSPSLGTLNVAFHDEEWLVDLFDGTGLLSYCSSNSRETNWTTLELFDDCAEDLDLSKVSDPPE